MKPAKPKRIAIRITVDERERFLVARNYSEPHALASVQRVASYIYQNGTGAMLDLEAAWDDRYDAWVAAGRPRRFDWDGRDVDDGDYIAERVARRDDGESPSLEDLDDRFSDPKEDL